MLNIIEQIIKFLFPKSKFFLILFLIIIIYLMDNVKTQENTLPSILPNSLKNKEGNYLVEKADLFFITTKDGFLHAYSNNEKKWEISLGDELITSDIIGKNVTNQILLLPLDDKIYIYENGNLTQLKISLKELVNQSPLTFNDLLLIGNKKTSLFIIDIISGRIIEKSDNQEIINFSKKKSLNIPNILTVIRVDYILSCLNEDQEIWKASYSDVIIQRGNERCKENYINNQFRQLKNLPYLVNRINSNEVMTIHSYYKDDNVPVKIYDKNFEGVKEIKKIKKSLNNDNTLGEIKQYFNEKSKIKIDLGEIINKKSLIYLNDIINYLKKNWIAFIIVFGMMFGTHLFILFKYYKDNSSKNNAETTSSSESEINGFKNKNINELKEQHIKSISEKNFNQSISQNKYSESNENDLLEKEFISNKTKSENRIILYKENNTYEYLQKFTSIMNEDNIKKHQKQRIDLITINSRENEKDNTITFETKKTTKAVFNKTEEIEKIHKEIKNFNVDNENLFLSENNSMNNTIKKLEKTNSFIKNNRKYTEDMKNSESIIFGNDYSKKSNNKSNNDKEEESISFDDDYEPNKGESSGVYFSKNHLSQEISNLNNDSNINKSTSSKTKQKYNIYQFNNQNFQQTRLDKDFTDIRKLGQGGFGVVLKAKHKIDEELYAIKIIKLSDLSEQNVVTEAKTMTKIRSKHIVEYKTCWFDGNLGSATKYFSQLNDSSSLLSNTLRNSSNLKKISEKYSFNKNIPSTLSKINESINSNDENNNKKSIIFEDENQSNSNNSVNKIFDIDGAASDDEKIEKNYKKIPKPVIQFRDDSNLFSKRSIISKKNSTLEENLYFFIQMEYCDGLPLDQFIQEHADKGNNIDRKIIFRFTHQILKSLSKIHSGGIIHRDIKPANIFINDKDIKIGDFGLATQINNRQIIKEDVVGTPLYLSPEQINKKIYNEKVDIYACGVILYEMCGCFYSLMERRESIINLRNKRIIVDKVKEKYPEESKLIYWMTESEANERPSEEDIFNSDYFKKWKEKIE